MNADIYLALSGALGALVRRWSDPQTPTWEWRPMVVDLLVGAAANVILALVAGEVLPKPTVDAILASPVRTVAAGLLAGALGYSTADFVRSIIARRTSS